MRCNTDVHRMRGKCKVRFDKTENRISFFNNVVNILEQNRSEETFRPKDV